MDVEASKKGSESSAETVCAMLLFGIASSSFFCSPGFSNCRNPVSSSKLLHRRAVAMAVKASESRGLEVERLQSATTVSWWKNVL